MILIKEFPDKWQYLDKKLAYLYEFFSSIDDHKKPVRNSKKEYSFSKLKNDYPSDIEIKRTKEIMKLFNTKDGEELTKLCLKKELVY